MPTAVLFPGQGSQSPGAGQPWFDDPAWTVIERAEAVLNEPLAPLVLDPAADLSRTRESQLSVLLLSLLAWEAARTHVDHAVAFAGHSLGQITALIAAGVVTLDDGIAIAADRAAATQRAADANPGGLAALLGATEEQAADACAAAPGSGWVANLNAPGQVVIEGTPDGLTAAAERAGALGVRRVRRLAVGGAFTPHGPATAALAPTLERVTYTAPLEPVVTNHGGGPARPTGGLPACAHLVEPVRWQASVELLVAMGVDRVVEVGPGTTLTSLVARIAPDLSVRHIAGPTDVSAWRAA
ncbi:MAG: ACP S-malonyltransferase [Acidimicrobiales bacterium]